MLFWAKEVAVGAGIQMGNTVTASYIVDSYPLQSMSIITFYAVLLNLSAFASPVCTPSCRLQRKLRRRTTDMISVL